MKQFLGRYFDERDRSWKYSDGSGGLIPDECRKEMLAQVGTGEGAWLRAYVILQGYKQRLGL